jgi:periplasmic copper chaperone A
MKKPEIRHLCLGVALGATVVLMAVPAGAGAHATVSPFQPQTTPLTAARTSYVLRVPNEKGEQNTYKVILFVPTALQEVISVKQQGDWSVRLKRRDTGKKNEEGEPVYAITSISWIAKKGSEIKPGFFGEFFIRFQNPVQPGRFCFPTNQYYRPKGFDKLSKRQKRSAKPELVAWTGPPDAEFPASCITTAAAPPAAH